MKKIIAVEWLSLDGYFSKENNETDWFVWDKDMETYYKEMFMNFDTILFGSTTYKIMADYWPKSLSADENSDIKDFMNNSRKIVFSKTLNNTEWNNSEVMKEISSEKITAMKQAIGKDILIFGSGSIVSHLTNLALIDEYKFLINPVFLGSGKKIFKSEEAKSKLKFLDSKKFDNGNIMLHYAANNK